MKIVDEEVFNIPVERFAVGASTSGYQLQFSADGETFTDYADGPCDSMMNYIVSNVPCGLYFKLSGNVGEVEITY